MSTYIVEALVAGKVYYEIEAESEKDAIKIAHKENANKKMYTEDGTNIELSVYDDIDTFTIVDKKWKQMNQVFIGKVGVKYERN